MPDDCVFCKIVKGDLPCHKLWEDEKHIAFLSIFPNTDGFTVVATKKHLASYIFDLDDQSYQDLLLAARKVGKMLDKSFDDVGRTGLFLEGFGVDHAHAKLFPMHGTGHLDAWEQVESGSKETKFFKNYPGYLSSHDSMRADDDHLARIAEKIREANKNGE